MRTITKLAALAVALGLSVSAQAEQKTLRVATDGAFPPYSMVLADGTLTGFDVEIAQALCEEMKVECQIQHYDFDSLIPALKARKFDMVVASMAITEERLKSVDFSDKYEGGYSQFIGPKGTSLDGSPAAMAGKKIGVQLGTIQENYTQAVYVPAGAEMRTYSTPENAFLDLVAGRLDAVVVEVGVGYELQKGPQGKDYALFGPKMDDPQYFGTGSGIAVRKGNSELLGKINQALAAILADGTYELINDRYFDYNQYD